jgi:hypothetical protein
MEEENLTTSELEPPALLEVVGRIVGGKVESEVRWSQWEKESNESSRKSY